jgi:hypothetical protein
LIVLGINLIVVGLAIQPPKRVTLYTFYGPPGF